MIILSELLLAECLVKQAVSSFVPSARPDSFGGLVDSAEWLVHCSIDSDRCHLLLSGGACVPARVISCMEL